MLAAIKGAFRRPLSEANLLQAADSYLRHPPFPQDYYDTLIGIKARRDGGSLIDLWRDEFRASLSEICREPTWSLQRTRLLHEIINNLYWSALWTASRDVRHPEAWIEQLLDAYPKLRGKTADTCDFLLCQRWMVAICKNVCFQSLGERLYGIDEMKKAELVLFETFEVDLQKVQIGLQDYIQTKSGDDPEIGQELIMWYDNEVVPILNDEWKLLRSIEDEIANGAIDIKRTETRVAGLQARREDTATRMPVRSD